MQPHTAAAARAARRGAARAQVKAACEAARGRDCQMGGFTRILHSGRPDELMDEIPTVVVDPLPDKENKGCGRRAAWARGTMWARPPC